MNSKDNINSSIIRAIMVIKTINNKIKINKVKVKVRFNSKVIIKAIKPSIAIKTSKVINKGTITIKIKDNLIIATKDSIITKDGKIWKTMKINIAKKRRRIMQMTGLSLLLENQKLKKLDHKARIALMVIEEVKEDKEAMVETELEAIEKEDIRKVVKGKVVTEKEGIMIVETRKEVIIIITVGIAKGTMKVNNEMN